MLAAAGGVVDPLGTFYRYGLAAATLPDVAEIGRPLFARRGIQLVSWREL